MRMTRLSLRMIADAPMKKYSKDLHYDATAGMRIR